MSFTRSFARKLRALKRLPICRSLMRLRYSYLSPGLHRKVFGIDFKNPLGLANGLDSHGEYVDELSIFGFSFIEIDGANTAAALSNVMTSTQNVVNAACINPAKMNSPVQEERTEMAVRSFSLLYDFVDMFVICTDGISSLPASMDSMLDTRIGYDTYKPVILKVLPETPEEDLEPVLKYCLLYGIDGVMVVPSLLEKVVSMVSDRIAVIAMGVNPTAEEAAGMIERGASLIELDPAILQKGPGAVRNLLKGIDDVQLQSN